MAKKPHLSFWQIWNMSFGFLGIQFGFALQNANVSRIFETLGADVDQIPILWIAAPLTGLLVQPIIGYWSDRTWTPLGRRRPFFLVGAILASIALFLMPNSATLWIAAGMLWIMDASINVSMEPFRAFVGDNLPDEQRTSGFAMQSFFIGTGAVIASALPWMLTNWLGVANTAPEGEIADSVKWSFYLGGAVFFLAVLWTVMRSREYSPEEIAAFETESKAQSEAEARAPKPLAEGNKRGQMQVPLPKAHESGLRLPDTKSLVNQGIAWLLGGAALSILVYQMSLGKKELYIVGYGAMIFGLILWVTAALIRNGRSENGFVEVIGDLIHMPKTMRQLAIVQFFSWFALFAMWIYSTSAISRHYYDMNASMAVVEQLEAALPRLGDDKRAEMTSTLAEMRESAVEGETYVAPKVSKAFLAEGVLSDETAHAAMTRAQAEYNKGGDWVGVIFAVYNGVAALFAFLIPMLARRLNRRRTHLLCMVLGGLGLVSIFLFRNPQMLIISMIGVGIAWASILSMPYAILSGALPLRKMGVYMGIFNFFIVIPQLVAASILGFLVLRFFGNDPIWALLIGGFSMAIAGILTLRVEDKTDTAAA